MEKYFTNMLILSLIFITQMIFAQEIEMKQLPKPEINSEKPIMQLLEKRRSIRNFSSQEFPDQVISNLLWAAYGINDTVSSMRTAPSAHNWQEVDIYIALKTGLYKYDALENKLIVISNEDFRGMTGLQPFVKDAAANLIYVADYSKMKADSDMKKQLYSAILTGAIVQNVYLFCASEGLGSVVRDWIDRDVLSRKMLLNAGQKIVIAQTVGYPEK
jgi:SagB-type dehydrogenase family enzyme